jgi:protein TonB
LHRVNPVYPAEAKTVGIKGQVDLVVSVDGNGKVIRADTASGDSVLAEAAKSAVKQWVFKPYVLNGNAVDVWKTHVTVRFPTDTEATKAKSTN